MVNHICLSIGVPGRCGCNSWCDFQNQMVTMPSISRQITLRSKPQHIINHYDDFIMSSMASQITSLTIVYSTVYSGTDQRKHQSSAALAFVRGIHRGPVNFPHKWPVTRKMFPFDDVIMNAKLSLVRWPDWCRHVPSNFLGQFQECYATKYGITRPQRS